MFEKVNLALFILGLVTASNLVLGFVIFFSGTKSFTKKLFLFLTISMIIFSDFTFFVTNISDTHLFLWVLRGTMCSAVIFATTFLLLALNFPSDSILISKKQLRYILIIAVVTALLTLTQLVFKFALPGVAGGLPSPQPGLGIWLFGIVTVLFDVWGIVVIVKKSLRSVGQEKIQFRYLLAGFLITLSLIIIFNFLLPVVFSYTKIIPYSTLFTLPFVILTSYAIIRHQLLDVKVIATEILTFVLAISSLVEVVIAKDFTIVLFRLSVFTLILGVGVLLIRSVRKEVQQREELQKLSKELEKVNGELKDLDKARADFITIASHQLRTPPATIKWYVAAILSGDFGELVPDVKAQLEKVQATNNSQISLIDDMLNASRIERGKMEFLFEEVEIEPMAKMTYDQLMPLAGMKGIKLVYNPPKTPLPKVMADIEKLRQVMNNFIDNAIKYTDKGIITAELFQEGDNIRFQVTDNGMGIRSDLAPHLFSKYARGQDSVTHAQGLGLGLYVCKMVVDQHQGKIWAESPGEGKGSTFIFTIPIHNNLKATTLVDLKMDGVK